MIQFYMTEVTNFNTALRELLDIFAAAATGTMRLGITSLRDKIDKAISHQTEYCIRAMGRYFIGCKKFIEAGDAKSILLIDHLPHLRVLSKEYDFDIADGAKFVGFAKQTWIALPPLIQVSIKTKAAAMLAAAEQYLKKKDEKKE